MTALPPPAISTPPGRAVGPQWLFLVIMAGLGMVGPFSIDTIFPAFAQMQREWGSSEIELQQLISVYLLSFAVMSLLHGPLSDALGRKPVIIGGTILFIAASVGCALSPSLPVLLFFRAIQGLSAGAGQIISRAMVRDVFSDDQAQRTMSHIAMIFGLAPALAPIVGGWLLGIGSWRGIFWFLVGFGVVILLLVIFALAETHPPELRLEVRRAHARRRDCSWCARDRDGRRLAFTGMFNFAGMFLYISSAPLFVLKLLGKGEQDFWILFVPLISGPRARFVGERPARRTDERTQAGVPRLRDQPRRRAGEPACSRCSPRRRRCRGPSSRCRSTRSGSPSPSRSSRWRCSTCSPTPAGRRPRCSRSSPSSRMRRSPACSHRPSRSRSRALPSRPSR